MTIDKSDPGLYVQELLFGGVLPSKEMAEGFASVILRGLQGEDELQKQQPLRVTDQGDTWLVEGSYQEPGRLPGTLSWYIVVQKYDSKVLKLGHRMPMEIPDEVKAIIAKAKRDRQ